MTWLSGIRAPNARAPAVAHHATPRFSRPPARLRPHAPLALPGRGRRQPGGRGGLAYEPM